MSDYPRFPNYSQLQSSMNAAGNSRLESHRATRSSLACLPCRSRHLKCDGKQPCSRCADVAKQCMYAQSRRGGLDRAALAERRKRLAEDTLTDRSPSAQQRPRLNPSAVNSSGLDGSNASDEPFRSSIPIQFNTDHIENDLLVDAYYKHFHKLHPFILPQRHLARLSHDQNRQPSFVPLIAVLRLIGSVCSSREWSTPLQNYAEACFSQASTTDPTMVQCRLLYSMVLFWHNYTADAKREMTSAARLAVDLEMFRWEFGAEHGADPVVRESWRRTWWTLCVIDVYYAGTLGTTKFEVMDIEPTMELPCEEADYESGEIPDPKSLQGFDSREFELAQTNNTVFSSFAYLVGAVRCAALAMSTKPTTATREDSLHVIQTADSILDSWFLFLPRDEKQVMTKTGEIDELMFQAHLLIHIVTISLHRPFSDLKPIPVENVSSCAREPPSTSSSSTSSSSPDLSSIHTTRVLRSVSSQIHLLALPVPRVQFHHSPFITCMIIGGALALLSACYNCSLPKGSGSGSELAIARAQIRMTIGRLRDLGEVWPRTGKNLKEVQMVASHVLELGLGQGNKAVSSPLVGGTGSEPGIVVGDGEEGFAFPDIEDLDFCGWCNLDPGLWGMAMADGDGFVI